MDRCRAAEPLCTICGWPGQERPALRDVSFTLSPGSKIALVGHNGSGKSTLVKLMCGLYRPDSGRILIDGQEITGPDPEVCRRYFSVVFQDYGRYSFTVQENVELGDVEKLRDDNRKRTQEVKAALQKGLAQELAANPGQSLGNLSEDGIELSGGQWQRLALARYTGRILVMQGGALVEEGDHDFLMKKDGAYASMYRAQSHWYL